MKILYEFLFSIHSPLYFIIASVSLWNKNGHFLFHSFLYGMSIYFFHFNLTKKRKSLQLKRIDLLFLNGRPPHHCIHLSSTREKMNIQFTDPKVDHILLVFFLFSCFNVRTRYLFSLSLSPFFFLVLESI